MLAKPLIPEITVYVWPYALENVRKFGQIFSNPRAIARKTTVKLTKVQVDLPLIVASRAIARNPGGFGIRFLGILLSDHPNDVFINCQNIALTGDILDQKLAHHLIPQGCLLYTSPSPRDQRGSRMPSSA